MAVVTAWIAWSVRFGGQRRLLIALVEGAVPEFDERGLDCVGRVLACEDRAEVLFHGEDGCSEECGRERVGVCGSAREAGVPVFDDPVSDALDESLVPGVPDRA